MLQVTDLAIKEFKRILIDSDAEGHGIRIFRAGGGWGPSLAMDIVIGPHPGDTTFENDGVRIFLEKEASRMLTNAIINYSDERGFEITGLQQSSCCG